MTCIVAETDGQEILFAADSAWGHGDEIYTLDTPKIFQHGECLFGVCGSFRVAQILRHHVEPPTPPDDDLESFLVRDLLPALRAAVLEHHTAGPGFAFLGEKTTLLIGCRGQLWTVGTDLIAIRENPFAAIGSGRLRAYGALHALHAEDHATPQRRLELALGAAAAYTTTVRPPWRFGGMRRA